MTIGKIERFTGVKIEEVITKEIVQKMINKEEFRINPISLEVSDFPKLIECEDITYFTFGWHYENNKKDICYTVGYHPFFITIDYDLLNDYDKLIEMIKEK